MKSTTTLIVYKVLFGLLGFSAVTTEIAVLIERSAFNPSNFFSFFTILSNILAFTTLFVGAYYLASGKNRKNSDILRGAATLYMVITGIVFSLLLANIEGATLTAVPWDNTVLHYIMPVALLVDWIIDRSKIKLSNKTALLWLMFPIVYVVYSLIRGSIVGWYPYPFLNPATSGYGGLLVIVLGIALLSIVLSFVLIAAFNSLSTKHSHIASR